MTTAWSSKFKMLPGLAIWPILLLFAFARISRASHSITAPATLVIEFNTSAGAIDAVPISKSLALLSIEFCYILDYLGDINAPRELTLRLLHNIQEI